MKTILVLVNSTTELLPSQSSAEIAHGFAVRGHQVLIGDVTSLAWGPFDCPQIWAHIGSSRTENISHWLQETIHQQPHRFQFPEIDMVFIRTNPGRDKLRGWAHDVVLDLMTWAEDHNIVVLNSPRMLRQASSKMYLQNFPQEVRPKSIISRNKDELKAFVREQTQPCILKPLRGTGGSSVFIVRPQDRSNLSQIIEVIVPNDYVIAQEYIPEADKGDIRLLILEGKPICIDGEYAAVARLRQGDDVRSNVAVGGKAAKPDSLEHIPALLSYITPKLIADGVFLAGLDIIGKKIVEVNVFSPGGIRDAGIFANRDFLTPIIDAALSKIPTVKP